jgi:hypothetical protein
VARVVGFFVGPATDRSRLPQGGFKDLRKTGLTIGECELNAISVEDYRAIEMLCGQPWTANTDHESDAPRCQIKAIARTYKDEDGDSHVEVKKILDVVKEPAEPEPQPDFEPVPQLQAPNPGVVTSEPTLALPAPGDELPSEYARTPTMYPRIGW